MGSIMCGSISIFLVQRFPCMLSRHGETTMENKWTIGPGIWLATTGYESMTQLRAPHSLKPIVNCLKQKQKIMNWKYTDYSTSCFRRFPTNHPYCRQYIYAWFLASLLHTILLTCFSFFILFLSQPIVFFFVQFMNEWIPTMTLKERRFDRTAASSKHIHSHNISFRMHLFIIIAQN